ncbi:kinetochore protein mis14 [Elsinoe australis]|uniref:Kinetochore protein mis14 n=1 Tax=Elsinoe australis TaxID=40998 RepID=A0A4U7ASJ2_9PEZI|nr:kinetochore protein mis14 [Elsinoe australis]
MDTTHRKIELQSPSDLQHLISSASGVAREKIDLHFPPNAQSRRGGADASGKEQNGEAVGVTGDDDPMRRRVEELVQGFIERAFGDVKRNVSINGLEGKELEGLVGEMEETEPFDHRLARRIQSVSSEIEYLTLQLANMRRNVPMKVAQDHVRALEAQQKAWNERAVKTEELEVQKAQEVKLEVDGLDQMEDMKRSWEEGTRRLVEVKDGIGGVVGKGERAREGVRYLEGA